MNGRWCRSRLGRGRRFLIQALEPRRLLSGAPITDVPALNSDPGAPATLYLDFHGEPASQWQNLSVPATPAYDIDGDPTTFSDQELANIQQIWARVAEAYSPFNVNVTTVDPGNWADGGQGQFRLVIGGDGSWTDMTEGGTAFVGSFTDPTLPDTAYVFPGQLSNGDVQFTADDAVHEAGHGFGLNHQSVYDGDIKTAEYNPGNGVTSPFMGLPWGAPRATWWYGQSSLGADVIQDDLATLTSTLGLRPLTIGQSSVDATELTGWGGNTLSGSGVIETTAQQDWWCFDTFSIGTDAINVNVAQFGAMLHARLDLYNTSLALLGSADDPNSLSQGLTIRLPAGEYYLRVMSYGGYGDLGQYSINAQLSTVAAPSQLTASVISPSQVNLAWTDNDTNGTGYVVQRSSDGTTFTDLTTLGPGADSFSDTTVPAGATAYYRVYAFNSLAWSPYSSVASTFVPATPVPAVSFVRGDSTTEGQWSGVYGSDGYLEFGGTSSLPSYAQVTPSASPTWTWDPSSGDPRALQLSSGSSLGLAACLFSGSGTGSQFSVDVNLTDGQSHQVAIYMLDWDTSGREQTVQVSDSATGAVLDTQFVSSFHNGQWLVWNLSGDVTITFTCTSGLNAVASGIMFDPVGGGPGGNPNSGQTSATFVRSDPLTEGAWGGLYGSDGSWIFDDAKNLPTYAQATALAAQDWIWNSNTADPRALQISSGAPSGIAACLFSSGQFTLDINLTDGNTHQVAIYMVDWDTNSRSQTLQVTDAATGALLDTQAVPSFQSGQWLVWNLSGHVRINTINNGGLNAVISGVFFDPVGGAPGGNPSPGQGGAATFLRSDTLTEGAWTGPYGADGSWIFDDANNLPGYAQVKPFGAQDWVWSSGTDDPRALQTSAGSPTGIAACLFSPTQFGLDVNFTDQNTHQVALYMADWDTTGRAQTVQITDGATGAILDTQTVSNFHNGQWLVWNLSGHVRINVIDTAGLNAVVSGIFFDPAAA